MPQDFTAKGPDVDAAGVEAVFDWLCDGAPPPVGIRRSLASGLKRMHAAGVPIDRFALFILTIHPLVRGKRITWSPGDDEAEVLDAPHEFFRSDYYMKSPARAVHQDGAPLRVRLCDDAAPTGFDDLDDMRAGGATDYLGLPLDCADGDRHVVSWATRAPGGFSDDAVAALKRINPPLARLIETYTLRLNTISILSTYVGRNAGAKVLAGRIERGDAERIRAAILFADLKGFTELSNARPAEDVLAALNRFYDALEPGILAGGGEILKFIGDEVLAIFPTDATPGARRRALAAARDAVTAARGALKDDPDGIGFRAALHVGDIHYGNIGGSRRLDFTVIGPAVNLTARLLSAASGLGAETVCSAEAAALMEPPGPRLGDMEMKGFAAPQAVHGIG